MAVDQLADLLANRAIHLSGLLGDQEAGACLASVANDRARVLLAQLEHGDAHERQQVAIDILTVAWGDGEPPADWWRTPLGRAVAVAATDDTGRLSYAEAGRILGITRQSARELAKAGRLDQHPDGGVTRASVMARLANA